MWGIELIGRALLRRCLPAVSAIALSLALGANALAFTVQNSGFSATTYAGGFATDGTHGPASTAWDGNVLWAADASDGGLYRADAGGVPGPATSLTATRVNVAALPGVGGVALGLDGRLYATLTTDQKVVELSKVDGSVLRVLTTAGTLPTPQRVATDPLSGDLIVTSIGSTVQSPRVWRISQPATTATPAFYSRITPSSLAQRGIAIGPDGTIFVVSTAGGIYDIESTTAAALHPSTLAVADPLGAAIGGIVGLSVVTNGVTTVPQFLIVTTSGGAAYKIPGIGAPSSDTLIVLDGAGAGADASTGPDRCAYASMGTQVIRIADASGSCGLALAGITPPSLSLANPTGQDPHVGGAQQTIRATLANASMLSGHVVTFTVTGANTFTRTATTDLGGNAEFSYASAVTGLDTIVATTTADTFPVTSNAITLNWLPLIDTAAPTIGFTYSVPAGGRGAPFACDTSLTSDTAHDATCGWFTQAPTIHWVVTPNGPSGLGALTNCADYTLSGQPPVAGQHQTCNAVNGDGQSLTAFTVVIDAVLAPPAITASATVNGLAYAPGAITRGPVVVSFACTSPIQTSLVCPTGQQFAGTGTYSATGTARDIAGQTATATFGPFTIDTTPPTISASAGAYVFGAWTNADVHLTFTCHDNVAVQTCPDPQTVTATTDGVTVTATDTAGNIGSLKTGAVNIDRSPPTITASATTADGHAYISGITNQDVIVHFVCGTDAAPIASCPADQVFHASGSATGTASDAAGNTMTTTFGPIVIDTRPPTVTPAATVAGAPYDGAWTRGPVAIHFTCTDENPGVVCPDDVVLASDQDTSVTRTASDAAGNTTASTPVRVRIDRTAPVTTPTVSGTLASPGVYVFTATASLAATDTGSGVASLTYAIDGLLATTVPGATASLPFNTEGAHTVTYHSTDAVGNVEADQSVSFSIIFRQHTTLAITSSPFVAAGTPVAARLLSESGLPAAGETVVFNAGGITRTAVTDATGFASVALALAPGTYTLGASYAGTDRYFPSDPTTQALTTYAVTRFVVYSASATVGATVQFYGGDWSKQIADKDARKGFGDFKGYADSSTANTWTGRSGDANKPARTIPQYIAVLLTTTASKGPRDTISGDVVGVAIVRVLGGDEDPLKKTRPYDGKLGDRGFGVVVSVQRP